MEHTRIGIIGGTGLGEALAEHFEKLSAVQVDTPFGKPSGPILTGTVGKNRIAFLARHGDGHHLNPSQVPFAANIYAMKKLGVTALIASGAVGSLREEITPREIVLADQFIDKTFLRQNTFFDRFGSVHCEFAHPTCRRLREKLLAARKDLPFLVHNGGTYVCMEGPQFSTRAESLMHRSFGGDLIGMTALPEAKLAREAQMCYALVAMVSDYDCWREHAPADKQSLLLEIIGNLKAATQNALDLILRLLESDEGLCDDGCHCRKSLENAVWTRPEAIAPAEKQKLSILFE